MVGYRSQLWQRSIEEGQNIASSSNGTDWRVFDAKQQEVSLFTAGYYGNSHEGNLVPTGFGLQVNDTVDPRQQDQTHTFLLAANDQWKASKNDELALSGYFSDVQPDVVF